MVNAEETVRRMRSAPTHSMRRGYYEKNYLCVMKTCGTASLFCDFSIAIIYE